MTYLAVFIVIWGKGLFYSDWLGDDPAASPIGPQLRSGGTGNSGTPPPPQTIEVNYGGFGRFYSHMTHHPSSCTVALYFSRSRTNYLKLFTSLLCVTYIRKISKNIKNDIIAKTYVKLKKN